MDEKTRFFIIDRIVNGDLHSAINRIKEIITLIQHQELGSNLILICHDYSDLQKQINKGILNKNEESIEKRKLIKRIIELFR